MILNGIDEKLRQNKPNNKQIRTKKLGFAIVVHTFKSQTSNKLLQNATYNLQTCCSELSEKERKESRE